MVSLVPAIRPPNPATAKANKPLLRRSTLSGTIRKLDDTDLDADLLSAPPSPSKRARVTFNPDVEEKVMEEYQVKGRSLETIRIEVKRAIEGHQSGSSEGYDTIKEVFSPRRADDEDDEDRASDADIKTYLIALTSYASLLNRGCSGLVKAVLGCDWLGRDEGFVKTYVQFLGSLASAQGAYIGMVLGMLVKQFSGGEYSYRLLMHV